MNEFKAKVKIRLIELGKNQNWLVEELKKYSLDVRVDASSVSQAISGKSYTTLRSAIAVLLNITNDEE